MKVTPRTGLANRNVLPLLVLLLVVLLVTYLVAEDKRKRCTERDGILIGQECAVPVR